MERLTEKHYLGADHYIKCSDSCNVDMDCIDCASFDRLVERLAAYEDTGLEPEEVLPKDKADEIALKLMRLADLESLCSYTRLRELADAEKDGRMVLLQCKVGDTVYRIVRDADPHITRDEVRNMYFADDMTLCVELISGRIILPEKFGKTVFLTCEEAEKALGAMKK